MKTVKELKKQVSKKDKMNLLLFSLICVITLTFTMGYSLLNQKLNISGKADYRVIADMRVTSLEYKNAYLATETWHNYSKNNIKMEIDLSNAASSITYSAKIQNMGENVTMIVASIQDNISEYYPYIKYEMSGFTPGTLDAIRTSGEEEIEFTITFSYIDEIKNGTQSLPENHVFIPNIIFNFEEVYSITYEGLENITSSNDYQTWYSESTPAFTLADPTKKGHTFLGWTGPFLDSATNNVTVVPVDGLVDRTYTATWLTNTYSLTIDPNGGTYEGSSEVVTMDILYGNTVEISIPTKLGYILTWDISNSDSILSGTTFTMGEGNTTLTANWTPITYTVSYDCNGMDGSTASSAHTYDVAKNLTSNGCLMTNSNTSGTILKTYGGSFSGWATSSDATSVSYSNEQSVINLTTVNNANIPLYAVWDITSVTYSKTKILNNNTLIASYKPNSSGSTYAFTTGILYGSYGDYVGYAALYENTYGEYQVAIDEDLTDYNTLTYTVNKCTDGYTSTTETGLCELFNTCTTTVTALEVTHNYGVGTSKNYTTDNDKYTSSATGKITTPSGSTRYCSGEEEIKLNISGLSGTNNYLYIKVTHGGQFTANTVWVYIKDLKISK